MARSSSHQVAGVGFRQEVADGRRFEFGRNWFSFLRLVDESRIEAATESLW